MPKVIRYYVTTNARTIRGHWLVKEVLFDGMKETEGRVVADHWTKKEALEDMRARNFDLNVLRMAGF